jgi:outer membrane protein assembly factor BamB
MTTLRPRLLIVTALVVGLALLAPPAHAGERAGAAAPWAEAWSAAGPPLPSVLAADATGSIAAGFDGEVQALDAEGDAIWRAHAEGGGLDRQPAMTEELVVVPTERRITALDRATGEVRWERRLEGSRVSIGVQPGGGLVVLASTNAGALRLLDAASGSTSLRTRVPGPSPSTAPYVWIERGVGVVAWSTRARCCRVGAIDLRAGTMLWTRWVSRRSSVPVVHAGAIVLATGGDRSGSGRAEAFDVSTGSRTWRTPTTGRYGPTFWGDAAGGDVVIADAGGAVHAFDVGSGEARWVSDPVAAADEAHPKVVGDRVFLTPRGIGLVEIDRGSGSVVQSGSFRSEVYVFSSARSEARFEILVGNGLESAIWAYEQR